KRSSVPPRSSLLSRRGNDAWDFSAFPLCEPMTQVQAVARVPCSPSVFIGAVAIGGRPVSIRVLGFSGLSPVDAYFWSKDVYLFCAPILLLCQISFSPC